MKRREKCTAAMVLGAAGGQNTEAQREKFKIDN